MPRLVHAGDTLATSMGEDALYTVVEYLILGSKRLPTSQNADTPAVLLTPDCIPITK